jgi:hypothetical protein
MNRSQTEQTRTSARAGGDAGSSGRNPAQERQGASGFTQRRPRRWDEPTHRLLPAARYE